MRKALVLVLSNLQHDARVTRQVNFLSKEFDVTLAAFGSGTSACNHFIPIVQHPLSLMRKVGIAIWSLLGRYDQSWQTFHPYRTLEQSLAGTDWDLIVANDADTLPMAFRIRRSEKTRVVFDAHEYAPRHFENSLIWRLIFQPLNVWICTTFIPKTSAMFTVGQGLADEYEKHFGKKPVIMTNAPGYRALRPSETSESKIRLVHHGIANPARRLDLLYDLMQLLDNRFTLDLYLVTSDYASTGTRNYIADLKAKLESDARIHVWPPVPGHQVVDTLHAYDAGIFLLPPINFNYANTLPNKFFDFIQARLAVIVGPSPEMAALVNRYDLGIVGTSYDPVGLAPLLNGLTAGKLAYYKQQSALAARELSAEQNEQVFMTVIRSLYS